MTDENKLITIWIKKTSADKLNDLKIHKNQPYYEIVEKLLEGTNESNNNESDKDSNI